MNRPATVTPIDYRPHVIGRSAKLMLPALRRFLPKRAYDRMYATLDRGYRSVRRFMCLSKVLLARLRRDHRGIARATLAHRLVPHTMGGPLALENAFDIVWKVDAEQVPGALVECGVAEGGTAAMMAMANLASGAPRREKWLFDSFEGLPDPTEEDYVGDRAGLFIRPLSKGDCRGTVEQVNRLMFDLLGFRPEEVRLVKGWFQDTVPAHRDRIGPISVLRLDGDWYESTKIPLENFYDLISPGGVVIIDDYATCYGSQRATDEFRESRDIASPLNPDGRGGAWFQKPTR